MGTQDIIPDFARDVSLSNCLRQSSNAIWPITKPTKKGNSSCKNWRNSAWKHMRTPRSTNPKEGVSSRLESALVQFMLKAHCRWDVPFVITNVFPHGVVELKDKATNNTFQVNGHQLKIFHEGPPPTVSKVESISLTELAISDGAPGTKPHNLLYVDFVSIFARVVPTLPTQEYLGPQEAPWPKRSCPCQASPFSADPSFSAQVNPEALVNILLAVIFYTSATKSPIYIQPTIATKIALSMSRPSQGVTPLALTQGANLILVVIIEGQETTTSRVVEEASTGDWACVSKKRPRLALRNKAEELADMADDLTKYLDLKECLEEKVIAFVAKISLTTNWWTPAPRLLPIEY
ncbi:hypothetical protein CR513_12958, partial [Mucuna pruriens]